MRDHPSTNRHAAGQIMEALSSAAEYVRASLAFLTRAVRYLAKEAGIRQFLVVGHPGSTSPGLPPKIDVFCGLGRKP